MGIAPLTRETDAGLVLTETLDDAGWAPEDRINNLNQVMRRDVDDGLTTTNWAYLWDEDGNLTSKSDGVDTWDYTWNEDNRLLLAELNTVAQVAFSYDNMGRMLTRTGYVGGVAQEPSRFEWDSWDLVAETAPDGTLTRYFCPQGELHSFSRGGMTYSVHADTLGSVRSVTDFAGRVVAHFEHDPWGNALPSSLDGVLGGFAYRFVGALGVRWEQTTGMFLIRHRWYDPELSRFVSRDLKRWRLMPTFGNRYVYSRNFPTSWIDVTGLDAIKFDGNFPEGCAERVRRAIDVLQMQLTSQDWINSGRKRTCTEIPITEYVKMLKGRLRFSYGPHPTDRGAFAFSPPYQTEQIFFTPKGCDPDVPYDLFEYTLIHEMTHLLQAAHGYKPGGRNRRFQHPHQWFIPLGEWFPNDSLWELIDGDPFSPPPCQCPEETVS